MSPLHHLSTVSPQQRRALYRHALGAGCGHVIDREHERLMARNELVAPTLPGLVRLGSFALLADADSDLPSECAHALAREAAGVMRLLDRALAAHARDHGYRVAAWLEHAVGAAQATAGAASRIEADAAGLSRVVSDAVDAVAAAVMALHRDCMGVAGELADALGSMLVLHVVATGDARLARQGGGAVSEVVERSVWVGRVPRRRRVLARRIGAVAGRVLTAGGAVVVGVG